MPREDSQWKPGQSGNPLGRPKSRPLSDLLRASVNEPASRNSETPKGRAMIDRLFDIAIKAKRPADAIAAMKLIFAYVEGLPVQPVDLELRAAARRIAERTGADEDWLIRRAEQIAAEAQAELSSEHADGSP